MDEEIVGSREAIRSEKLRGNWDWMSLIQEVQEYPGGYRLLDRMLQNGNIDGDTNEYNSELETVYGLNTMETNTNGEKMLDKLGQYDENLLLGNRHGESTR